MTTPSKAVKSAQWFIRVDGNKEFLTTKCQELANCIDTIALLAFYHVGEKKDNPHCHIVLDTKTVIQKQSFAVRLKTLFCIEKKSQYALQPWDGNRTTGAVSYMFHEDTSECIFNKGFTDGDLESARLANDAVQRVVKLNKEKASGKLVEKAMDYAVNELKQFDAVKIVTFMLSEIKDGNHYHPGDFMLKRYLEEIEVRMCNDLEGMAQAMVSKWYR